MESSLEPFGSNYSREYVIYSRNRSFTTKIEIKNDSDMKNEKVDENSQGFCQCYDIFECSKIYFICRL